MSVVGRQRYLPDRLRTFFIVLILFLLDLFLVQWPAPQAYNSPLFVQF